LVKLSDGTLSLRSQYLDLLLRRDCTVLRNPESGLFLLQIGRRLLRLLYGVGASLQELLTAVVLLPREGQRRLRLRHLLIAPIDLGLLPRVAIPPCACSTCARARSSCAR
jgi:hypothetical protein